MPEDAFVGGTMKFLLVTGNFASAGANPWLLDDLASAIVRAGHSVDVIVASPTAARPRGFGEASTTGLTVWSVGAVRAPRSAPAKAWSYMSTAIRIHTSGWTFASRSDYDAVIFTSIAAFAFGFPGRFRRARKSLKLIMVMWDFFPIHQVEIGRIRGGAFVRLLKFLEWRAIRPADTVAVMTPANDQFLRAYHPSFNAKTFLLPPWASDASESEERSPLSRFTAVFGGQLAAGRGVDVLLRAAEILEAEQAEIDLVIAGDGPDRERLTALAEDLALKNIQFVGALPRPAYRDLLASAHVGVAITVPGVSPPSFPSKIVEYCACSLPVVVAVESSSDAGSFVEQHGAGIAVAAGDPHALANALRKMHGEHMSGALSERSNAARKLFQDELSVDRAALQIISAVKDTD